MWGFSCTDEAGKVIYSFNDEDEFQDQFLNRFNRGYYKPPSVFFSAVTIDDDEANRKKRSRGEGTSGEGTSSSSFTGGGGDKDNFGSSPSRVAKRKKAAEVNVSMR